MKTGGDIHRSDFFRMRRHMDNLSKELIREALKTSGPVEENRFRHYSVLIPMIERPDGIHLLYEVRGKDLDRQPGEICFPGGEVEKDEDYRDCAVRETFEEIGVDPGQIDVMEELTTVYGVGFFAMHCFPGFIDAKAMDGLCLNEEVDEVFTVPLRKLLETDVEMYQATLNQEGPEDFPYERVTGSDSYGWSRLKSPVPVYDVDGRCIWGLTGRATKVLLDVLKGGNYGF